MAWWAEEFAAYDIRIKYVSGIKNPRADALSKKLGYKGNKAYNKTPLLRKLEDGSLIFVIRQAAYTAISRENPALADKIKTAYSGDATAQSLLHYFKKSTKGLLLYKKRIYLLQKLQEKLVREQHKLPAYEHQGIAQIYSRISRKY